MSDKTATVRDVDDFLADLDDVLATTPSSTTPATAEPKPTSAPAPTAPAPAPAEPTAEDPDDWYATVTAGRSPATETVPDLTQHAPEPTEPRPESSRIRTITAGPGHLPDWRTGPTLDLSKPAEPNVEPELVPAEPGEPTRLTKTTHPEPAEPNTDEPQDDEPTSRAQRVWALIKSDHETRAATPADAQKARRRTRKTVFATTAYAVGWTFNLTELAGHVLDIAADYAIPASGCALAAGVLGLTTRSKAGGIIFATSLGLIGAMAIIPPAYFVGGALTLTSLVAYRTVRGWLGQHADTWPWKGVAWVAFVPTATTTVTTLLHGTN